MAKKSITAFQEIKGVRNLAVGETDPGVSHVQSFLRRFGYLTAQPSRTLDEQTSEAIAKFQAFHGLPTTGEFDEPTRELMTTPRCGLPDMQSGLAFATQCAWNKTNLLFSFDTGTNDVAGTSEFDAVRAAFTTWSGASPLTFSEVASNQNPDVGIGWRLANDPDHSMVGGVLAHADFPPGCSVVTNSLPKPLHFDDEEHTWTLGATAGAFDVETVALHEIGHILGLAHSSVPGAVMAPTVSDNFTLRVLTPDDVSGIQSLYGGGGGAAPPPWPGRLLKYPPLMQGADVSTWQQRMSVRGFTITVDGLYGPQSKGVCIQFQQQQGLQVDGIVGPITWGAAFGP